MSLPSVKYVAQQLGHEYHEISDEEPSTDSPLFDVSSAFVFSAAVDSILFLNCFIIISLLLIMFIA